MTIIDFNKEKTLYKDIYKDISPDLWDWLVGNALMGELNNFLANMDIDWIEYSSEYWIFKDEEYKTQKYNNIDRIDELPKSDETIIYTYFENIPEVELSSEQLKNTEVKIGTIEWELEKLSDTKLLVKSVRICRTEYKDGELSRKYDCHEYRDNRFRMIK